MMASVPVERTVGDVTDLVDDDEEDGLLRLGGEEALDRRHLEEEEGERNLIIDRQTPQ